MNIRFKSGFRLLTIVVVLLSVLIGGVTATFWPRRSSSEARPFALAAITTPSILAVVNFLIRGRK